jgi:ppGpp synthetase/RelA/SpoT-type nucleotidyltranferase
MNRFVQSVLAEEPIFGFEADEADFDAVLGPVSDYPIFDYSMKDVKRAGEVISGALPWTDETEPKIRRAFQIANNWRDAHAYPMRSIRHQLISYVRHLELNGITAARLKRMQAIRKKLRRPDFPMKLNQVQDLGGCRAILSSIDEVRALVEVLRHRSRHELKNEDDYIASPKPDGYRSHHLIMGFRGSGKTVIHNGRRIEIQIRTRLQHSWATAVEAIGLFRGENLKGNQGSEEWLRFFKLMSAEFAEAEGCPVHPDIGSHSARIPEIKKLDKALEASATLDNLSHAVRSTEANVLPREKPTHFLIRYNNIARTVDVQPYFAPISAVNSYDMAEDIYNKSGEYAENIVLVEVDKIENLKDAYPNYFGDVQLLKVTSKNTPSARPTNQIQRISLNLTTGSGCDGAIGFL